MKRTDTEPAASPGRGAVTPAGAIAIALGVALVPFVLLVQRFNWLNDDAFISFRYAANLARGDGLSFNPGVVPPTEGYSNFLWVVYLALVDRIGFDITLWSRLTSIGCGVLLLAWLTVHLERRFRFDWPTLTVLTLSFATLPAVAIWSTSGLAMMPTALFVFGTFERLLGDPERPRPVQAGLFAAAAALIRADGIGFVALVLAGGVLQWMQRRDLRMLRALGVVAGLVAAAVALHLAFRWSYYDSLVPNTARVKAGFSPHRLARGFDYVVIVLLTMPAIALGALAGLAALRAGAGILAVQLLVLLGGGTAYAFYIGGDFMPMGRLFVPVLAFVPLLVGLAFERLIPLTSWRVAAGAGLLALSLPPVWNLQLVPRSVLSGFQFRRDEPRFETEWENWQKSHAFARNWVVLGRALKRYTRPGESIVLYQIGAAGYYADHLTVYDMYALTDREAVRHGRLLAGGSPGHDFHLDWGYFLDRDPTYMAAQVMPLGRSIDLSPLLPQHPWLTRVELEVHPLRREDGFPPNRQLVLGRLLDEPTGGGAAEAHPTGQD